MTRYVRGGWETQYAAIGHARNLFDDGPHYGLDWATTGSGYFPLIKQTTAKNMMTLNNRPNFDVGLNVNEARVTSGRSVPSIDDERAREYWVGTMLPTTTWEFYGCAYNLPLFLWSFFQTGASEGAAGEFMKTFYPYSSGITAGSAWGNAQTEMWMDLAKIVAPGTEMHYNEVIYSAVCSALSFTVDENSLLSVSATMNGSKYTPEAEMHTGVHGSLVYPDFTFLKWQNATVLLDGAQIYIPGLTFNMSKALTARTYGTDSVKRFINGPITVDGTFQIPAGDQYEDAPFGANDTALTDLLESPDAPHHLLVYWGNANLYNAGDFGFMSNFLITNVTSPDEADNEHVHEVSFAGIQVGDDALHEEAVGVACTDGYDRAIP